ncbi:MAG: flagellar hook-length control protein FliK, partial [Treponema sp.]|nr:flagellar hook-length control protein FliK [Treponema sp.]
GGKISPAGEKQHAVQQRSGNISALSTGKDEQNRLLALENQINRVLKEEAEKTGSEAGRLFRHESSKPASSGWDRARGAAPGQANVLAFSFRDMEAQFLASQGVLRPADAGQKAGIRNENNEKGNSRLDEARGKKGRLNIDVRDLRTGSELSRASGDAGNSPFTKETASLKPVNAEIEIPVDLGKLAGRESDHFKSGKDSPMGRSFEDTLARELRGGLSTDIVRDAAVIVRNGGEGTIRLSLRPASLGDVKIRLEMTENKITGHIIVESNEALRAFERELPVLEKAFRDSGFSETNLEMSLAQDGRNFGEQGRRQEADLDALMPVLAASRYENGTEWIETAEALPDQDGLVLSPLETGSAPGRTPVNMLV